MKSASVGIKSVPHLTKTLEFSPHLPCPQNCSHLAQRDFVLLQEHFLACCSVARFVNRMSADELPKISRLPVQGKLKSSQQPARELSTILHQSEAADNVTLSHSGTADKLTGVCPGAADDIAVAQSEAANNLMLSRLGLWISSQRSTRELPMILP